MCKRLIYLTSFVLVLVAVSPVTHAQVDNLLQNPSFEEDGVVLDNPNWEQWTTWNPAEGAGSNAAIVDTEFIDGTRSLRVDPRGGTDWYFIVLQDFIPLTVGNDYTASFWAKAESPRPLGAQLKATDNSVSWGGTSFQLTTEWAEYTFTSGAENASAKLEISCAAVDVPLWLDFVFVYEGQYIAGIEPGGAVPIGQASDLKPADGQTDLPRDVVLSWTPGDFAAPTNGHNVYFGESFNDVNDGIGGITQSANSYAPPQRLDFNTTYYWRVDEVNAPPDSTVFEGDVLSFTTEPIAYAIENITATASSSGQADMGPENTINGSGLDANDLHSIEPAGMWLSGDEPNGAWIEYELDKVYKLHEMWVWNSNGMMESILGFGFKDVTIEYSTNGTEYTTLDTTHEFARAPGADGYEHNTTIDFSGVTAKYVRLTANSRWGDMLDQYGLSEVRFFYIPVLAREPSPDSDTTDVAVDMTLSFRAGREADKHDVYLSNDEQAVIDGNAPVTTVTEASFGPLSLDLGTTYYWKTNEVNDAETPTTWQGDIWNFSTHEFFVVDGFEDYNDYPPDEIWTTWVDGYGVPANGATVGYPAPNWGAGEHYAETTIVHGADQSMPFFYDNTGAATYSEGKRTFAVPQDWAKAGVQTLTLYFYGDPNNAASQMYVKVNGAKVVYDGDAADIEKPLWNHWNIDLASLGVDLQNVTTLAIGIDGNGTSGTLYFDDIRLYRSAPAKMDSVAVENFSFELPGTEKQLGFDNVPGWNTDGPPADSGVETGSAPTDGDWIAYLMSGDPSVWQLADHTITEGDVFEVKVDAAITWAATTLQMAIYYDDNGTRVPAATSDVTLANDMQEYTLSFSASDVPESVGHQIGIEFTNTSSGDTWIGLDNVRLYVALVE